MQQLPFVAAPSVFFVLLAIIYFLCWIWQPANEQSLQQKAIYLCFVVFALLFLCVQWHPQWLILLTPFMLLTTWQSRQPQKWMLLNGIFFAGYFVLVAYMFAGQIESNLFDFGIFGQVSQLNAVTQTLERTNTIYFNLIPYLAELAPVAFAVPLVLGLVGKFPFKGVQLFDMLNHNQEQTSSIRLWVYGLFFVGFGLFWFAPTLFAWCKTIGIL